jgi:tetratricopeptide (TPR) repeat protein
MWLVPNLNAKPGSLALAKPIKRAIAPDETHSYTLNLNAGQYAHLVVDQHGADVVIVVYGSDGKKIVQVDSPNGINGVEPVFLVADTAGLYRFEVRSQSTMPGRYEVKLEELRATTEPDRNRIEAQQLFEEAKALRSERTEKSYQQSIEKYETAIAIWHKLNEKLLEAYSLHEVGMIYGDIGLFQKAIDAHTNAADLYKELKLPKDEAAFLTWLGLRRVGRHATASCHVRSSG